MSKSKGNVVTPTEMCAKYGADTARLYTLFAAPPEKDLDWSDAAIEGAARFLSRVYRLVARYTDRVTGVESGLTTGERTWTTTQLRPDERRLLRKVHQTLRHITKDMEERWHFNTDIAMIMDLSNEFADLQAAVDQGQIRTEVLKSGLEHLLVMLSLFAPHVADELWEATGHDQPLLRSPWPAHDPELAAEEELEIPVQINGRLRGRIRVAIGASEEEIRRRARADPTVAQHLNGRQVVRIIVVPQKLVNIVIK